MQLKFVNNWREDDVEGENIFYSAMKFCGRTYSSFDDFKRNERFGIAFIVMGIVTAFFTFLCVMKVFGSSYLTNTSILGVATISLFIMGWSSIKCCGSCNKK